MSDFEKFQDALFAHQNRQMDNLFGSGPEPKTVYAPGYGPDALNSGIIQYDPELIKENISQFEGRFTTPYIPVGTPKNDPDSLDEFRITPGNLDRFNTKGNSGVTFGSLDAGQFHPETLKSMLKEYPDLLAKILPFANTTGEEAKELMRGNTQSLSGEELDALTQVTITHSQRKMEKLLGPELLMTLPKEDIVHLLSSTMRGDLADSPKAISLLKAGKGEEAAAEFLNNEDFKKYLATGSTAADRFLNTAEVLKRIGNPLEVQP